MQTVAGVTWSVALTVVVLSLTTMSATQQPVPSFTSNTNLVTVDAQVVAAPNAEVPAMTPGQFEVRVDGRARTVVFVELLHMDEGPVNRDPMSSGVDSVASAACVFRFERVVDARSAHYLLGLQRIEGDEDRIGGVRVRVTEKDLSARRWAWRKPQAATTGSTAPATAPELPQP